MTQPVKPSGRQAAQAAVLMFAFAVGCVGLVAVLVRVTLELGRWALGA